MSKALLVRTRKEVEAGGWALQDPGRAAPLCCSSAHRAPPYPLQWYESYERLAQYVVPQSAKILFEDVEYGREGRIRTLGERCHHPVGTLRAPWGGGQRHLPLLPSPPPVLTHPLSFLFPQGSSPLPCLRRLLTILSKVCPRRVVCA